MIWPYLASALAAILMVEAFRGLKPFRALAALADRAERSRRIVMRRAISEPRKERALRAASLRLFRSSARLLLIILAIAAPLLALIACSLIFDLPELISGWDVRLSFILASVGYAIFTSRFGSLFAGRSGPA